MPAVPAPRWLARFNRRFTNRLTARVATRLPGLAMLVHTGRKSGTVYRTPINVFKHGNRLVIALTYGPRTEWVRNVQASGGCLLEMRGQTLAVSEPRLVHDRRRSAVPVPVRIVLGVLGVADFLELTPSGGRGS